MTREGHVRFCEGLEVKFLRSTHPFFHTEAEVPTCGADFQNALPLKIHMIEVFRLLPLRSQFPLTRPCPGMSMV